MAEAARQRDGADIATQAVAMKSQMRAEIHRRFLESKTGQTMARGYEAAMRGVAGPAHDIYRRVFEQSFFNKDLFDGRYQHDMSPDSMKGIFGQYDMRAEFYGHDAQNNSHTSGEQQEKAQEQEQPEQGYGMEHDNDNDIGM